MDGYGGFFFDRDCLLGDSLGHHELVELGTSLLGDVNALDHLIVGIQKDGLRRLARNPLELGALVFLFKILVDESLHLLT